MGVEQEQPAPQVLGPDGHEPVDRPGDCIGVVPADDRPGLDGQGARRRGAAAPRQVPEPHDCRLVFGFGELDRIDRRVAQHRVGEIIVGGDHAQSRASVAQPRRAQHPAFSFREARVTSVRPGLADGDDAFGYEAGAGADPMEFEVARYRQVWRDVQGPATLPKMGVVRFIVVADSDANAMTIARRAYLRWRSSFTYLSEMNGTMPDSPRFSTSKVAPLI